MSISKLQQQNIAMASAYTEYTLVVPPGINELTFALRGTVGKLFWHMTTTNGSSPGSSSNLPQSPNPYCTVQPQASAVPAPKTIRGKLGGQTIYLQTDTATQVLEVSYYSDN
jgi:hypothetical protein